jgi:hypothetical protein
MMRKTRMRTIIASLAAMAALVCGAEASGPHCSTKTLAGNWAFTVNGTITGVGPVASVGSFTADKSGNISGSQTRSLAGAIAEETLTGSYTVNPDCTGTEVIQVFESGVLVRTSTLKVIFDENGRGARAIFTLLVLPNGTVLPTVLTVEAKRINTESEQN